MKKLLCLVLAALMLLTLVACAEIKDPTDTQKIPDTNAVPDTTKAPDTTAAPAPAEAPTPAEIEAAIAAALGEGYLATETVPQDEIFTSAIGWLDQTKVKSCIAKQALVSALNMDQIAIAECEDGYADEAVELFNQSFAQTVSYVRQYPFGVAKVENARIYKVGNTVMLIIAGAAPAEDADAEAEAKLAADEYAKIDAALAELFGFVPENLAVIPEDNGGSGGLLGG